MRTIKSFDGLLFLLFSFIGAMLIVRIMYSGSLRYLFLIWNLFLAWIPYVMSGLFSAVLKKKKLKQLLFFMGWLLFFPNALYIITDLIHLQHPTSVPLWYDAVLLFTSAFSGLIMAFVSLQRAENFLKNIFMPGKVALIVPFLLFLGAFGVYLGRFQRWNSWNVINDPLSLGIDIFSMILSPFDNLRTWGITLLLTALYSILYFFIRIIPYAFAETTSKRIQF